MFDFEVLRSVQIPELSNNHSTYFGMDTLKDCRDATHFNNFPHEISYSHNLRGFRDNEWPEDSQLKDAIWCVGDSFTVGVGSPFEHTWPQVLKKTTSRNVINVSLAGGSNEWISRKCCEIYDELQPPNIVIMWSYLHRLEDPDTSLSDFKRRISHKRTTYEEDAENLKSCYNRVVEHCTNTNFVMFIVPNWGYSTALEEYGLHEAIEVVDRIDIARDGLHFDIETSKVIAEKIAKKLLT